MSRLLTVEGLTVKYETEENGTVYGDRAVSLNMESGKITGIIGESGSGKSSLLLAVMGLLPANSSIESGTIQFDGKDICRNSYSSFKEYDAVMSSIRGKDLTMVFQNPMSYFDPTVKIRNQISEVIRNHRGLGIFESRREADHLLESLGVPDARKTGKLYPMQVNGGLLQKANIAIALANHPKLLLADEPFSALDDENTNLICEKFVNLRDNGSGILIVLHDLDIAVSLCDELVFIFDGCIEEFGPARQIVEHPVSLHAREFMEFAREAGI